MSRKKEKNLQIINAASDEFLTKGLDAASMHNIAELAEVSKRTLYKYYPTKDELYSALIDEILDRVENIKTFEYTKDKSIKEQIENIIAAKIKLTLDDSFIKISKIILGELFKSRMPSDEQMDRLNKSEASLVEWIRLAKESGQIKSELKAEEIAGQFHSILKGQIYWPVMMNMQNKENLNLERIKIITTDFFIKSFC